MKHTTLSLLAVVMLVVATPSFSAPSSDWPELWALKKIENGLIDIGLAHGIQENCDTIEPNRLRGLLYANSLGYYAVQKGYKWSVVRKFFLSEKERAILREKVIAFVKKKGIRNYERPNALCALGMEEIKKNSRVGVMLRTK